MKIQLWIKRQINNPVDKRNETESICLFFFLSLSHTSTLISKSISILADFYHAESWDSMLISKLSHNTRHCRLEYTHTHTRILWVEASSFVIYFKMRKCFQTKGRFPYFRNLTLTINNNYPGRKTEVMTAAETPVLWTDHRLKTT